MEDVQILKWEEMRRASFGLDLETVSPVAQIDEVEETRRFVERLIADWRRSRGALSSREGAGPAEVRGIGVPDEMAN